MKFSTYILPVLGMAATAAADITKQCTIGKSVECTYNGFSASNKQYRCAVPGQYAVAYAWGVCPSTYGGFAFVKSECITSAVYTGRHKCRDGFNKDVAE